MKIVYDPRHVFHNPNKSLSNTGFIDNPDKPERIESIKTKLSEIYGDNFIGSRDFPRYYLYLAHTHEYVNWIKNFRNRLKEHEEYFPTVFEKDMCFDAFTPLTKNSFDIAWISVKSVLTGIREILSGEDLVYVLNRPMGHMVTFDMCGGYGYFNNVAIAAKYFQKQKPNSRVAILDIDFHHGKGLQEIFYDIRDVFVINIHATPELVYPYLTGYEWEIGEDEGEGYNLNFPLSPESDIRVYMRVLEKAILEIEDFSPDILIVAFGTNINEIDSKGFFKISVEDFSIIGEIISQISVPILVVQEGGFNFHIASESAYNFIRNLL